MTVMDGTLTAAKLIEILSLLMKKVTTTTTLILIVQPLILTSQTLV